jgi:hypothetical protein
MQHEILRLLFMLFLKLENRNHNNDEVKLNAIGHACDYLILRNEHDHDKCIKIRDDECSYNVVIFFGAIVHFDILQDDISPPFEHEVSGQYEKDNHSCCY